MASGPVLQAGAGGAAGDILSLISEKMPDIGSTRYLYIAIFHTHREVATGTTSRFFWSRYPYIPIFLQYQDHIRHDIGEKPDIGFGKERVCADIDPMS